MHNVHDSKNGDVACAARALDSALVPPIEAEVRPKLKLLHPKPAPPASADQPAPVAEMGEEQLARRCSNAHGTCRTEPTGKRNSVRAHPAYAGLHGLYAGEPLQGFVQMRSLDWQLQRMLASYTAREGPTVESSPSLLARP